MDIFFQARNLELDQPTKDFMANRMYGLSKFFSPYAKAFIDVEKTRSSRNGDDLYYVSINIEDARHQYFTEEYQENIRKTFDHAYGEMFSIVRNDLGKARSIARRAGASLKRLFR